MIYENGSSATVGRRCLAHVAVGCTNEDCLLDEQDWLHNPNRPRPQATPGAPEVSWGQVGLLRETGSVRSEDRDSASAVAVVRDEPAIPFDLAVGLARLRKSSFNRGLDRDGVT